MSTPQTQPSPTAADYARMVDDLTYHYDGIFGRETVEQAVEQARAALEPVSRIPAFLPILTERFARDQLLAAAQAEGEDWGVADPAGQTIEVVRAIRDDIQARVTTLLGEILHKT